MACKRGWLEYENGLSIEIFFPNKYKPCSNISRVASGRVHGVINVISRLTILCSTFALTGVFGSALSDCDCQSFTRWFEQCYISSSGKEFYLSSTGSLPFLFLHSKLQTVYRTKSLYTIKNTQTPKSSIPN